MRLGLAAAWAWKALGPATVLPEGICPVGPDSDWPGLAVARRRVGARCGCVPRPNLSERCSEPGVAHGGLTLATRTTWARECLLHFNLSAEAGDCCVWLMTPASLVQPEHRGRRMCHLAGNAVKCGFSLGTKVGGAPLGRVALGPRAGMPNATLGSCEPGPARAAPPT